MDNKMLYNEHAEELCSEDSLETVSGGAGSSVFPSVSLDPNLGNEIAQHHSSVPSTHFISVRTK